MRPQLTAMALCFSASCSSAQDCNGTAYLNPQSIRGESASAANSATASLVELLKPSAPQLLPVISYKRVEEFVALSQRPSPPCAIYGNPIVGFVAGNDYIASAVNHESINAAIVFIFGSQSQIDAPPEPIASLPAKEAEQVMATLKRSTCFGMAGGVTTALIVGSSLCGTVTELAPSEGRGQSYLPSHAAFAWSASKPVGFITRDSSGARVTMKDRAGTDAAIHQARLVLIPAVKSALGYGLYLHKSIAGKPLETKLQAVFSGLKPDKLQQQALDIDATPNFRAVSPTDRETLSKSLDAYLSQQLKRGK